MYNANGKGTFFISATVCIIYSYLSLLLTLLAHLYNQPAAAYVYAETNGKIGALVRVYTETNGTYVWRNWTNVVVFEAITVIDQYGLRPYRRAVSLHTV